ITQTPGANIPHRWSVAHYYQAILSKEEHVSDVDFLTTLAGYVHWKLTGVKVLGVGDASGMFPIDSKTGDYDIAKLEAFDELCIDPGVERQFCKLLPNSLHDGGVAG